MIMKKVITLLAALIIAVTFASTDLSANKKIKAKHKKPGKDGAKITCSYCHKKGKIKKKKGGKAGRKGNAYCVQCHKD